MFDELEVRRRLAAEISALVRLAEDTQEVIRVWLFGSRICGNAGGDSDLDIAIEVTRGEDYERTEIDFDENTNEPIFHEDRGVYATYWHVREDWKSRLGGFRFKPHICWVDMPDLRSEVANSGLLIFDRASN